MKQEEFNKFLKSGDEIPDEKRKTLTAKQESFYKQLEAYCLSVAIEKDLNTRCEKCGSKHLKISYPRYQQIVDISRPLQWLRWFSDASGFC